jgi:putative heme-binding domain-containing protein
LDALVRTVGSASAGEWRPAALEGLAAGLRGRNADVPETLRARLAALFAKPDPALRRSALRVLQTVGVGSGPQAAATVRRSEGTALDGNADAEARADAIALLALSVQTAAARALGAIPGEDTARFLLKSWRGLTANVRMEAADALYRDPNRIPMVLAALKNGNIQPWTLAFRHRRQLLMHKDPALREQARALLDSSHNERVKVIAQYQAALDLKGDVARGRQVFDSICAKCHKLDGKGAEVGPDLGTVRHQPKQVLLAAILNPSESISQGFEAYVVETISGASYDGVLGPQTATSLSLRHEEGKEDVIQRRDIRSMYATNLSAMPADLEKQIDVQQMADLLEFIKSNR